MGEDIKWKVAFNKAIYEINELSKKSAYENAKKENRFLSVVKNRKKKLPLHIEDGTKFKEELESSKRSPLLRRKKETDESKSRKIGVSERNKTERIVVYQTLKNYITSDTLKFYELEWLWFFLSMIVYNNTDSEKKLS